MSPELRRVMREQNVYVYDLANLLGITSAAMSMKLSGKNPLKLEEAYKILRFLHLPYKEVYRYFPPRGEAA